MRSDSGGGPLGILQHLTKTIKKKKKKKVLPERNID